MQKEELQIELEWIDSPDQRETICRDILTQLPEWFGIPESTEEYCISCRTLNFLAALLNSVPIGFIATRENSDSTVELYVLGVLSRYHRSGVGTKLFNSIEKFYRNKEYRFVEVKTLDQSRSSVEYDRTRKFYEKCGFFPLETLTELWGRDNPCLIMVKSIEFPPPDRAKATTQHRSNTENKSSEIRRATAEDVSRLAEIQVNGWRNAYSEFLEERYLYGKMTVSKRIDAFSNAIETKSEEIYVLVDEGSIKGFLIVGPSRDKDKASSFELWAVYIEPAFQRMGFGRSLVNYFSDQARLRGYREITLWVFTKNSESRAFYERLGFSPDGREDRIDFLDQEIMRYSMKIDVDVKTGDQEFS